MQQLQEHAPQEVLSSILSYAGPSAVLAMGTLNRSWRRTANHQATYQALSEALGKLDPERPSPSPSCWRTFYRENILVPEDCATLTQAIRLADQEFQQSAASGILNKRITIWLRPGNYALKRTLVVNVVGPGACLSIRTRSEEVNATNTSNTAASQTPVEDPMEMDDDEDDSWSTSSHGSSMDSCRAASPTNSNATLVMETKECNCPLLCLQQGTLELNHVGLEHFSEVHLMQLLSTKNENAAILLKQPQNESFATNMALNLIAASVTSYSGKGILNRAGGQVSVLDSFVARPW